MRGNIVKFIYRILLTLDATILIMSVYLVKIKYIPAGLEEIPKWWLYVGYILLPFIGAIICLWSTRYLTEDSIEGGIINVEEAQDSYLPTYLGYFFVSLGIEDKDTLIVVFVMIFIFTGYSQTLYFNPMFLFCGYRFYYLEMNKGRRLFVITKRKISDTEHLAFYKLRRINDFTFIDKEKYK